MAVVRQPMMVVGHVLVVVSFFDFPCPMATQDCITSCNAGKVR